MWFLRYLLLQIGNKVYKGVWWVLQWEEPIADAGVSCIFEGSEQNKRILSKNKWQNKTHYTSNLDAIISV